MLQDLTVSEKVISSEQTQQYVNYIMAIEKSLNQQKRDLNAKYQALAKKNNFILDFLIVLSCCTTAGFFSFLALQKEILTYITGASTAISTVLSLLSARWKYGEVVESVGKIYNQLDDTTDEFGYLRLRLGTMGWTTNEVMAYLEKLSKEVDTLEDQLLKYGILPPVSDEPVTAMPIMKKSTGIITPRLEKTEKKDEILDALKGFFVKK